MSIAFLMSKLGATDYTLCLSDDTNFRKGLYDKYKGQRSWMRRPLALKAIRKWFIEEHDAVIMPNLEGDDVMGILATDPHKTHNTIIVSIDKDMKTIPGHYYRDDTLFNISSEEAEYYHLFQTLTGDVADGYPGCPKVGKVTAKEILDKDCSWEAVVKAFKKAKLTEEDALLQARLARILRHQDYNFEENVPYLWTPRKEVKTDEDAT